MLRDIRGMIERDARYRYPLSSRAREPLTGKPTPRGRNREIRKSPRQYATLICHRCGIPVMEIVPGIHRVDGVNGNTYIIERDGLTVIDTGIPGSGKKILAYIRKTLHRDPSGIRTVIITHFHTDHIGGIPALKDAAPGLKLAAHERDAGFLSGQKPLPRYSGIRGVLLRIFTTLMATTVPVDIILHDGDRVAGLLCIHLPGHTPGSIGLLDEESGTLLAGDLLRWDGSVLSEGPAGFTLDVPESRNSVRKIAMLRFDTLLIGHGKPLRPGADAKVREFAAALPG
jgi:glyoxylase-like metal-dependent hydrolase (beta-lactamase superfamily II)